MTSPECNHHAYSQRHGYAQCSDCEHGWIIDPAEYAAAQEADEIGEDGKPKPLGDLVDPNAEGGDEPPAQP